MRAMNRAVMRLAEQIEQGASRDEMLRTIDDAQRAAVAAKSAPVPPAAVDFAGQREETRELALDAFRIELRAVIQALLNLEKDLMDGNLKAARLKIDQIEALERRGHGRFGVDRLGR